MAHTGSQLLLFIIIFFKLYCPSENFPIEILGHFSQREKAICDRVALIPSLVFAVFLCDHTASCAVHSFTTDG